MKIIAKVEEFACFVIFIQLVKPDQVSAGAFHKEKGKKLNKNQQI